MKKNRCIVNILAVLILAILFSVFGCFESYAINQHKKGIVEQNVFKMEKIFAMNLTKINTVKPPDIKTVKQTIINNTPQIASSSDTASQATASTYNSLSSQAQDVTSETPLQQSSSSNSGVSSATANNTSTISVSTPKLTATPVAVKKTTKAAPVNNIVATPAPTPTQTVPVNKSGKINVGYIAAWAGSSSFSAVNASELNYINYAFAKIGSDDKITLGYPATDPANFVKLHNLKNSNPNLKLIISVGGWSWSDQFSNMALTDASRTIFADSCVSFLEQYGFDGIDLDWEYPTGGGMAGNSKSPADKHDFTLLLQTLREKLTALGAQNNKYYTLTFAGGSGKWYMNDIEATQVQQYIDFANVMTYDYNSPQELLTGFNAPLYSQNLTEQTDPSIDVSIKAWINAGFSPSKMVLGVPFYGYKYNNVIDANNGYLQAFSGGSSISFKDIYNTYLPNPAYIKNYSSISLVPYLWSGSTFISYDDENSLTSKVNYAKQNNLAGMMIWELSSDKNNILLNAVYNALNK